MRRGRRLLGGTALLCAAIAGAAPAITVDGWTLQHVAHDAARFSPVSLAGNQRGAAVLAWLAHGRVRFAFRGRHQELLNDIGVADVKWTCERLRKITDRQWRDAFGAGGYTDEQTARYVARIRQKVEQGLALR